MAKTKKLLTKKELIECQQYLNSNPGGYQDFITYKRQKEPKVCDFG